MADCILIEALELSSFIGVPDEERTDVQRLTASLVLEPIRDFRALEDQIENTVDYFVLKQFVKALSLSRPRRLIETLAEEIAAELLTRFPLRSVEVELRKFILSDAQFVAVRIRRENGRQTLHP
jgi:dihydroneopterin aldolase